MKKSSFITLLFTFVLLLIVTHTTSAQSSVVTVNADAKIDALLLLKKELEKKGDLSDGYTIQLYYGNLTRAEVIKKEFQKTFTTWSPSIKYETPNYKVWAGNFSSRLEADRALIEIKEKFDSAFVIPNK